MSELHLLSTQQLITGLQDKQFSSAELTEHYIKRVQALDNKVNSFITTTSQT
ncbi:Asp-tRNA(Asn)/Glu-tRNA(Gln) amidotransferase subunit GatA, partial [Psychrobacter sp. T6-1]